LNRKRIINIVKWVWLIAVLGGVGWYVYKNFRDIGSYLSDVSLVRLLISVFFLIAGKFILADMTRLSIKKSGDEISYKEAFSINSTTQLGKYLPGGIWHFAGKFSIYKINGLSVKDATRVMIIETFWLFSSAAFTGLASLLLMGNQVPCQELGVLCNSESMKFYVIPLICLWIFASYIFERILFKEKKIIPTDFFLLLLEQIITWILLGISFLFVFPPASGFAYGIIGAFSISWLVGYAAVFAPGGIGIRELMLAVLLGAVFSRSEISILATIHRLIWVICELLLGGLSMLVFGVPLHPDEVKGEQEE
jgi:hypothetical protein